MCIRDRIDHGKCFYLVDCLAVCFEFLIFRHFYITEYEYECFALARCKCDLLAVGSDRRPAVCDRISRRIVCNNLWIAEAVVHTDESISVCIKAVDLIIYSIESKVITSVSVFCLVIYSRADYLNTSCREVSLEVCAVILRIP